MCTGHDTSRDRILLPVVILILTSVLPASRIEGYDDLGGDEVTIAALDYAYTPAMAIAGDGDIFVAVESHSASISPPEIRVYRSRDGGETWQVWGEFAEEDEQFKDPCLVVAEGAVDRVFLAYTHWTATDNFHVEVAYSDLGSQDGNWTRVPVENDAELISGYPSLASDHLHFDGYNLYLVYAGRQTGPAENDIWFVRSIDQGESWQAPYLIADNTTPDSDFTHPAICYGSGNYVHVAWQISAHDWSLDEVFYRRAEGRADSGADAWGDVLPLTTFDDGFWDHNPQIAASLASSDVLIVHQRKVWGDSGWWEMRPAGVFMSHDQGATFASQTEVPGGLHFYYGLVHQSTTDQWIIDGTLDSGWAIQRASAAGPLTWSSPQHFSDDDAGAAYPFNGSIAVDPTRDDRIAAVWILWEGGERWVVFDAEWRRDPGYPNLEPGFPYDLDHMPISPPGLVDLDGDGDLEIVYGSNDQRIHAWHHDGSPLIGWPVDVGHFLTDGPVAIGDLRNDGTLYVVAGTMDGLAVAYLADGQPAPGWPFDAGTGEPAYVSIGALGGEDARSVIVASGTRTTFASWQGVLPTGALVRNHYSRTHIAPCAAGDIDGDGTAEAVCGPGNQILAFRMCMPMTILGRYLTTAISDAVTLADLDLDGVVEILAPTSDGTLFAMHGNGNNVAGAWPFVCGTSSPLTSVAVAQVVGSGSPELAMGSRERAVRLLDGNGVQRPGFPVFTGEPWDLLAAPIIGPVAGDTPDLVIADRANLAWSWNDAGAVNPGFPRDVGEMVIDSPALGDLDLDGNVELVVLTGNQLRIFDLGRPPLPAEHVWPMYGHDAQRTGCADCPENLPTTVPADQEVATLVNLAPPNPNPTSGSATFSFAVPSRALVTLEIFDVRGRRVCTVLREECEAGNYHVDWSGRDGAGRNVAAGHYLARVQAQGAGIQQTATRKVTVLR